MEGSLEMQGLHICLKWQCWMGIIWQYWMENTSSVFWVLFGLLRAINKQGDEMRVFTLTPGQGLFILPLSLGKKKKKPHEEITVLLQG